MDRAAHNRVKRILKQGESLLWAGRPEAVGGVAGLIGYLMLGLVLGGLAGVGVTVLLFVIGIAVALFKLVTSDLSDPKLSGVFTAVLMVFAVITGIFAVFAGVLGAWWGLEKQRTTYAITNRRLLILRDMPFMRPEELHIEAASFRVEPGGKPNAGSVIFMRAIVSDGVDELGTERKSTIEFAFHSLADIRPVQRAFEQAQRLAEREAG